MANVKKFTSRSGAVIFDFDKEKITYDRNTAMASAAGLISMEINMREVTDIEIHQPTLMKLGGCNIIVNGIRYVNSSGFDMTQFAVTKKSEFPELQAALQEVLSVCGVNGFKANQSVNARKEQYTENALSSVNISNEYSGVSSVANKEYRKKCNVCGKVFCYTDAELKANLRNSGTAVISAIGGIAGALGGGAYYAYENNKAADRALDKVKDFNKCPECNSTDLVLLTDEEWEKYKTEQNTTQTTSNADEIKKFKELLDLGAISQEEFDAKKKQLLGL